MRSTNGPASRKRRKRWLKAAKGFGCVAVNSTGTPRTRWITVDNMLTAIAATRSVNSGLMECAHQCRLSRNDITYSRFIEGLQGAEVEVNRKVLADIAAQDEAALPSW